MLYHKTYLNPDSTEWICLVHGAGGSSVIWFQQIKFYQEHYNVLILDLRGHGQSLNNGMEVEKEYSMSMIRKDVMEVLDHLKIESAHFVGISLGTILIQDLAKNHPEKIKSQVLGGAISKIDWKGSFLLWVTKWFYQVLPYIFIYRLAALVVLPKKTHKASRNLFISEAKKLNQKEFNKWFKMLYHSNAIIKELKRLSTLIPTLYIMGDQDYFFLKEVKKHLKSNQNEQLSVIPSCGHVVNFEKPSVFNDMSLKFIKNLAISSKTGKNRAVIV